MSRKFSRMHYRFRELEDFERQVDRIPDTQLGELCRLMLERYVAPRLASEMYHRRHCACGALVKHHTGLTGPPVCRRCKRIAELSA